MLAIAIDVSFGRLFSQVYDAFKQLPSRFEPLSRLESPATCITATQPQNVRHHAITKRSAYAISFSALMKLGTQAVGDHARNALVAAYSIGLMLISTACFDAVAFTKQPDGEYTLDALPSASSVTDFASMLLIGLFSLFIFLIIVPFNLIKRLRLAQKLDVL